MEEEHKKDIEKHSENADKEFLQLAGGYHSGTESEYKDCINEAEKNSCDACKHLLSDQ